MSAVRESRESEGGRTVVQDVAKSSIALPSGWEVALRVKPVVNLVEEVPTCRRKGSACLLTLDQGRQLTIVFSGIYDH